MKKMTLIRAIPGLVAGLTLPLTAQELGPPPLASEADFVPVPSLSTTKAVSVNPMDRTAVVRFYQTTYRASEGVAAGWTGNRSNCDAGTTSQAYADATVLRVNYFRALVGLPGDIVLSNAWNLKAQEAALMMSAQGQLSHDPDSSWACYTTNGAQAAGNSNLALGADAARAIDLYMDDPGTGNFAAGHRRWILYPPTKIMGAGNIPGAGGSAANDLWVIGGAGSRPAQPEWVAWPPKGYVCYQNLPRSSRRWSFSYRSAIFTNAAVFMQQAGTNVPVTLEEQKTRYGDNTIVWVPQGVPTSAPANDLTYTVTVSNVVVGSQARVFTYDVTIIDPDVPALTQQLQPDDTVRLSWPSTSTGYTLQRNASLSNPAGWTAVTPAPSVVGGEYVGIVTATNAQQFFRLRKP